MNILQSIRLEADSPKKAWYELQLVQLLEGYAVIKVSGPQGSSGQEVDWFFRALEPADKRYTTIVNQKTARKSGRQYKQVDNVETQGSLWELLWNAGG